MVRCLFWKQIMTMGKPIALLQPLPATATNADALALLDRMRRLVARWETLPDHENRSMTSARKKQANRVLDELEESIRRNMEP